MEIVVNKLFEQSLALGVLGLFLWFVIQLYQSERKKMDAMHSTFLDEQKAHMKGFKDLLSGQIDANMKVVNALSELKILISNLNKRMDESHKEHEELMRLSKEKR